MSPALQGHQNHQSNEENLRVITVLSEFLLMTQKNKKKGINNCLQATGTFNIRCIAKPAF